MPRYFYNGKEIYHKHKMLFHDKYGRSGTDKEVYEFSYLGKRDFFTKPLTSVFSISPDSKANSSEPDLAKMMEGKTVFDKIIDFVAKPPKIETEVTLGKNETNYLKYGVFILIGWVVAKKVLKII